MTDKITRIDVSHSGKLSRGHVVHSAISYDGRYVVFSSTADDLVPNDSNNAIDIFIRDRQQNTTTRVSVASDGTQGNANSGKPSISADGQRIVFESDANNLVSDDTNDYTVTLPLSSSLISIKDIFIHDMNTHETKRISVSELGAEADSNSKNAMISANGQFVGFDASHDIVPKPVSTSLVLKNLHTNHYGKMEYISEPRDVDIISMSADGQYVLFRNYTAISFMLPPVEDNVFIYDRVTNTTRRVTSPSQPIKYAQISADGRTIVFSSANANMLPNDTNNVSDILITQNPFILAHSAKQTKPTPSLSLLGVLSLLASLVFIATHCL